MPDSFFPNASDGGNAAQNEAASGGAPIAGAPKKATSSTRYNPVFGPRPDGQQQPGSGRTPDKKGEYGTYDKTYTSELLFYHPAVGSLTDEYGLNYVTWDYRMNTQHYATYAGEVVQILSVAVDDIVMRGQIATYEQMEALFQYFARYMERATQGSGNPTIGFDETPMRFQYPMRNWDFYIQPKAMVGFHYGREVVAPEWEITAAVYDANPSVEMDLTVALTNSMISVTNYSGTSHNSTASSLDDAPLPLEGQIGFNPNNPFSNPFPQDGITAKADPKKESAAFTDFGKYYNDIVNGFAIGDYHTTLDKFGSSPNLIAPSKTPQTTKKTAKNG